VINPISIDALLLRQGLPDLVLRPGSTLMARVAERHGRHGILTIAGVPLVAELPEGIAAGATLRLVLQEADARRVLLKVADEPPPPQPTPVAVPLPLPGGARAALRVDEEDAERARREGRQRVALTYESPALGPLRLELELRGGAVTATVAAGPGRALEVAEDGAAELRAALAAATGRPAEVTVVPRREPFEAYA
jgi:hypothetical protein